MRLAFGQYYCEGARNQDLDREKYPCLFTSAKIRIYSDEIIFASFVDPDSVSHSAV